MSLMILQRTLALFLLWSICCGVLCAQHFEQCHRLAFYNVENYFDPADNPATGDDEYTPQGDRHWGYGRMKQKYNNIAKVLMAVGEGTPPVVIGLAEVENDSCIYRLLHNTSLFDWHYRYVITDSKDTRGINIAMLYQPDEFRLLGWESWRVEMPKGIKPTRDLLHAFGRIVGGDTLDVVFCHLPSRLGGAKQSDPARKAAHKRLFSAIDSLALIRENLHVVVMGDMNDMPNDIRFPKGSGMINLMLPLQKSLLQGKIPYGSHKYQGEWGFLDQVWVNKALEKDSHRESDATDGQSNTDIWIDNVGSVAYPFMLTEDNTHLGHRPLRSYYGYQYEGGFSDHLPIKVDLHIRY